MNTLRLDIINLHAPYRVKQREDKPQTYYFKTEFGVEYQISLEEDFSIVPSGTYALDITNREHKRSPLDPKFKLTLIAIISRKDNPRLQEVIQEFEDTISFIFD